MPMVRRSRQEWEAIVREYVASGKSAARFAAERGLNRNTLLWWSAALKRERPAAATFVDVVVTEPPATDPFVVVLAGSNHRVVVPRSFDGDELRRLVDALC